MSNVKIKDKYTYNRVREVNKPIWVGIVPVKLLKDRSLLRIKNNNSLRYEKIKNEYTYK